MTRWRGDDYQRRFDALAASGTDVHGEADFVASLRPVSVLDAGCGTGRVAIELASRGIDVVGVDANHDMLETARRRAPDLAWVEGDVSDLDLGRVFDVVVMAGNVPLFTPPGTEAALVAGCARHVRPGGYLVAGFQVDGRYAVSDYDEHARPLVLHERFSTWSRDPWHPGDTYAVSVHVRAR